MSTVLGGLAGTMALVSFGTNDVAVLVGGLIDTTASSGMAFSMPRDGTITSIAAYYSVAVAAALVGSTVEITAQLYSSPTPNDSFAPIAGTEVALAPTLSGLVTVGTTTSGELTGLSIPVTAGTRILYVMSAQVVDGIDIATILTGMAGGGIGIV